MKDNCIIYARLLDDEGIIKHAGFINIISNPIYKEFAEDATMFPSVDIAKLYIDNHLSDHVAEVITL